VTPCLDRAVRAIERSQSGEEIGKLHSLATAAIPVGRIQNDSGGHGCPAFAGMTSHFTAGPWPK
jgi:hypothetical protein